MITLQQIDPNQPISEAPAVLNGNFTAIKQHIDDLEGIIGISAKTIKLTNFVTLPNGSAEMASLVLTGNTGLVLAVAPNGGAAAATLDFEGRIAVKKLTASGTGTERSVIADLLVSGASEFTSPVTVNAAFKIIGANARKVEKYRVIQITDANIGPAATNPVDASKDIYLMLDCDNGGNPLCPSGQEPIIKLDTTQFMDGQILWMYCYRKNVLSGQKLYNGTAGAEIFAYINPTTGYQSISYLVYPEFAPQASPNSQSWIKLQWTNIGGGNYRLVVLDSLNVNGVS